MVGGKATDWSSVSRPSHKKQGRFCGLLLKWLHDMKLAKLRRRQESRGSPINVGAGHSMHKVLGNSGAYRKDGGGIGAEDCEGWEVLHCTWTRVAFVMRLSVFMRCGYGSRYLQ